MTNTLTLFLTLSLLLAGTPLAAEEIYKQVDEHGNVTYSNKPIKGGKKIDLPPLSTIPGPIVPPPKAEQPKAAPPEVDKKTREQTLRDAIANEEKALEEAKNAAKEGADKPEVWQHTKTITGKDGKPTTITERGRNVGAYDEKMKKLNDEVALHEKTLASLKAELASLLESKEKR